MLQISWRNVFRNKRRTALTLTILVLGSTGLILVGGFLRGIDNSYRDQFIHSQTGHLQVNVKGYFKKGSVDPFAYLITGADALERQVTANPQVKATVPLLKFGGMAGSDNASVAVLAVGVDPVKEARMNRYQHSGEGGDAVRIVGGKNLDPSDPYGVILGKGLMEALGLKLGDRFNFLTTRRGGAIDGSEYYVRGIFQTIVKEFDDRSLKMNLASAQKVLGLEGEIHSLLVVLDNTEQTHPMREHLAASFQKEGRDLEILTWEEQGDFYRHGKALLYTIFRTVQTIIAVVFFFSIANTVNMVLFERMREFGTMMALGNPRRVIFSIILFEAAFLGIMGAFSGLFVGGLVARLVSSVGITMPPLPGSSASYLATIVVSQKSLVQTFFIGFVSTLFAAVIPAIRMSKMRIVQALGYV